MNLWSTRAILSRSRPSGAGCSITQSETGDGWAFIEGPDERATSIVFVTVPESKAVKNRIHIDLTPTDREQSEEVERRISLGATRVDVGQGDVNGWSSPIPRATSSACSRRDA